MTAFNLVQKKADSQETPQKHSITRYYFTD